MRRFICALIIVLVIVSSLSITPLADGIGGVVMLVGNQNMLVSGNVKPISSTSPALFPYISNSRVLVPLRAVSEAFGAEVSWDDTTKTATIKNGDSVAQIAKDSSTLIINGNPVQLDAESGIIYGSFFLPLRAVAEHILGKHVEYVENEKTGDRVIVITGSKPDKTTLDFFSNNGAQSLKSAVDTGRTGLSEDNKYYYISGRAYPVKKIVRKQGGLCTVEGCSLCGQDLSVPLISFNYKLMDDPMIKRMIQKDLLSIMEPVEFNGQSLYIRREFAGELAMILNEIKESGYVVNAIGTFRVAEQDFVSPIMAKARNAEEGILYTAFHPNGLAIDINPTENPMVYVGSSQYETEKQLRYELTDPISPQIHFNGHVVAEAFKKHGWEWGLWRSSSDYMHFSVGEY